MGWGIVKNEEAGGGLLSFGFKDIDCLISLIKHFFVCKIPVPILASLEKKDGHPWFSIRLELKINKKLSKNPPVSVHKMAPVWCEEIRDHKGLTDSPSPFGSGLALNDG
jgi:hypothetical protein